MDPHFLMALDRVSCFSSRNEAPFAQRRHQYLIEPGVRRRFDKHDIESAVRVNVEARGGNETIRFFPQVLWQYG